MSNKNKLEIDVVTNIDEGKLERVKNLLTEIKELKEEIFGKQETN